MEAKLYHRTKSATQSGKARNGLWVLEFLPSTGHFRDSLVGWVGSTNTMKQVCMYFDSIEEAETYAQKEGINIILRDHKLTQ